MYHCEPQSHPRSYTLISRVWGTERGRGSAIDVCTGLSKEMGVGRVCAEMEHEEMGKGRVRRKACVKYSWLRDAIDFHLNISNPQKTLMRGGLWLPNSQNDKLPK